MSTKRERGTGSLRLRGTTWWMRYYHAGKLVEESTGTSDEQLARRLLRQRAKRADTPLHVDPATRKVTFADLLDLVRGDAARRGNRTAKRLGTAEQPGKAVRHLSETFGDVLAMNISEDMVDKYGDARIRQGAKPATLNRELAILRHGLKLALRKGMLPRAPHVTMRVEDNTREGFVDPPEFATLLAELRQRDACVADYVECAYLTLLRRNAVRLLTWTMCDLEVDKGHVVGGTLQLPGRVLKNKRPLTLPVTGRLLAVLDRRWQARVATTRYVFHHVGRAVGHSRFDRVWHAATAAAGVGGLVLHDLRRSSARTLVRSGTPEDVVMKLGGWRTRSMLTRYNIVDTDDLADAQAQLDAALASPGPRTVVPLRKVER